MAKTTTTKEQETAAEADKLAEAKNIVPTNGQAPALTDDMLKMMAGDAGKQTFAIREMMVPVLKIVQTISGVMKASSPDYIKEAKEGQLTDTLTNTLYDPPLDIIIVRFENNYIESLPKMGRTVRLWGSDSTGYDRAVGGSVGIRVTSEGNEIRNVATYYAMLLRPDGSALPCILYMGSTAWKEARKLNTLLGALQFVGPDGPFVAPPYAMIYRVRTVPEANEKNTWMTWKFDQGPLTLSTPNGGHLYARAKALEEAIDKSQTRIVGTQDDERFAASQERRQAHSSGNTTEVGVGPAPAPDDEDNKIPF